MACGRAGYFLIEVLQIGNFIMGGIVQTQGAGSLWEQAFGDEINICQWAWIIVNAVPFLLFLQIPSFSQSWPMIAATALTVIITLWRVGIIIGFYAAKGKYCHVCYGGQTPASILSGAANLVFTFGSHAMMPEEIREMVVPKQVGSVPQHLLALPPPFVP